MKLVAIISQALRASHCYAYLNRMDGERVILTSDPSAFDGFDLGATTRVVSVSPPPELLPSSRLIRARIFRSILDRARSGSRLGRWLERTIKRFAWRLRYLDRFVLVLRRGQTREFTETSIPKSALYATLAEEHENGQIGQIVVFDVFDLPVALGFSEGHGVDLKVR